MMQHAHTWSVWDQIKKGIWGEDTNNEVHMLHPDCHKEVDELLIQAQAAERRADAAKARAAAERRAEAAERTYIEIDESDADEKEDEEDEELVPPRRRSSRGDTTKKRNYTEIDESDADEQEDEGVFEVFECPDCGENGCDCPPRYVGA
jgi:hypothetical protein